MTDLLQWFLSTVVVIKLHKSRLWWFGNSFIAYIKIKPHKNTSIINIIIQESVILWFLL